MTFQFSYATNPTKTQEGIIYDLYLNGKAPLDGGGVVYPKGKLIGRIGKLNNPTSNGVWVATNLNYSPFSSVVPTRTFNTRRDAALWLLGIFDSNSETFKALCGRAYIENIKNSI